MGFTKEINKDFKIENNRIILSKEYLESNKNKFKKITGSRFASIIGQNKYCSPAKVWALMTNIYFEPMDDFYSTAGNVIEPKIRNYVSEKTGIKYLDYDPKKIGFDIFKDNKYFGGIPDGEPVNDLNNLDYSNNKPMLEIKTTSIDAFKFEFRDGGLFVAKDANQAPIIKEYGTKKLKWFDSNNNILIPIEYQMQLSLYCYLRNIKHGLFAVAFLEHKDYIKPQEFICNEQNIFLKDFQFDRNQFENEVHKAIKWYDDFIKTGISPELELSDWNWIKGR
ncbi:MAG: YqaJ viral recombinase family protein [Ureaplasma sp.]|nr:YqaJ viral recombinase family protein [Ureaplasma sp.]